MLLGRNQAGMQQWRIQVNCAFVWSLGFPDVVGMELEFNMFCYWNLTHSNLQSNALYQFVVNFWKFSWKTINLLLLTAVFSKFKSWSFALVVWLKYYSSMKRSVVCFFSNLLVVTTSMVFPLRNMLWNGDRIRHTTTPQYSPVDISVLICLK